MLLLQNWLLGRGGGGGGGGRGGDDGEGGDGEGRGPYHQIPPQQQLPLNQVSSECSLISAMMRSNNASQQHLLQQRQQQYQRRNMMAMQQQQSLSNQGWDGVAPYQELSPIDWGRQVVTHRSNGGSGGTTADASSALRPNFVTPSLSSSMLSSSSTTNGSCYSNTASFGIPKSTGNSDTTTNAILHLAQSPGGIFNPLLQQVGLVPPIPVLNSSNNDTPLEQQRHLHHVGLSSVDSDDNNNGNSNNMTLTILPSSLNANDNNNVDRICVDDNADFYAEHGMFGPWSSHAAGLLGNMIHDPCRNGNKNGNKESVKRHHHRNRKPKDRPKRPLSAYNVFFREERSRILDSLPGNDEAACVIDGNGEAVDAGVAAAAAAVIETSSNRDRTADSLDSGDFKANNQKRKRKRKGPTPHGKIGFESLAKLIGKRWQELDPNIMDEYKQKAQDDMQRYKTEMEVFKERRMLQQRQEQQTNRNALCMPTASVFNSEFLKHKPIVERTKGLHLSQQSQTQEQLSSTMRKQLLQLQQQLQPR
jgi:hypothetical protein